MSTLSNKTFESANANTFINYFFPFGFLVFCCLSFSLVFTVELSSGTIDFNDSAANVAFFSSWSISVMNASWSFLRLSTYEKREYILIIIQLYKPGMGIIYLLKISLYQFKIITCSSILLNSDLTSCTCLSKCEADTCSDITEGPLIYVDEELKYL